VEPLLFFSRDGDPPIKALFLDIDPKKITLLLLLINRGKDLTQFIAFGKNRMP
jgi:hypothetical protein